MIFGLNLFITNSFCEINEMSGLEEQRLCDESNKNGTSLFRRFYILLML